MRKKALALVLSVVMIFSMIPVVNAAVNPDYKMALVGTEEEFYDSVKGITFDMQIKGPAVGNTASVIIKIDAEKLEFVTPATNTPNTVSIPNNVGLSTLTHPAGWGDLFKTKAGWVNSVAFLGSKTADGKTIYLAIQPEFSSTNLPTHAGGLTSAASFCLAFKEGVTVDDLDASTVQICTIAEIDALHQSEAAVITDGATVECNYNPSTASGKEQTLEKPEIIYPNYDVMNLNGVKLDAANRYVNVPVSLPTAGDDVTVATTATGYYTSDCAVGTEIASGVTYTYSLQIKEETGNRDLTAEEQASVSIGTDGVVTVKAGAPEAVVVITATGSYTNTKSNTTTASGTFELQLRHGDANNKSDTDEPKPDDPPKPIGGGDDVTKTARGVAIYEAGKQVTTSAATSNYQKAVAIPTASETITFEGKVVDQFGDAMGETGTWTVTKDSTAYTGTNPGFNDGVVTIAPAADKGTYHYTYGNGTFDATVEITVDDNAITWPTLTNDTIVYGQTTADLTYDGGTVAGQGVIDHVVFSWKDGQTLNATATSAVMECNYTVDGVAATTAEHSYNITVNKAGQKIVTDVDSTLEGNVLQLPVNETVDLNTIVQNADVDGVVSDVAPTYTVTGNEGNLITLTDDVITPNAMSSSASDMATITINAIGNDNYTDAAPRTIQVYVTKPMLRATITFSTTTPVYGGEITATITEAAGQEGSLTTGVAYQWGKMVIPAEGGTPTFEALEAGTGIGGNLSDITNGTAKVKYTPAAADIGSTLALRVTSADDASYNWIHYVQEAMAAPVAKATYGGYAVTVKSTTYNSVTVTGTEHALFAILPKSPIAAQALGDEITTWIKGYDEETGAAKDITFTQDDAGAALTANTEYTVYMKMEGTDTHEESAVITSDAKTKQQSVTPIPNLGGDPDPIPADISGIAVTAVIDETAGLKYDETLSASVTVVDSNEPKVVDEVNDFEWDYQWVRVTPAVGDAAETEEEIEGATNSTYKLVAEDIGKTIKVKVTTKDTCKYAAVAEDVTSDVIAKADGPVFDDTLDTEKASNATATDGAITGLENGKTYEIAVKPAAPEEGQEPAEPTWETKTADTEGKITGLGVNAYLVRIPETATQKASNSQEVSIIANGYNITGVVVSYNAKNSVTYELYVMGENGEYADTATYTGTAVAAAETTTATRQTQNFLIEGIADGTYKLVIKKTAHVSYTINNVQVNGQDVDLTQDAREAVHSLEMAAGELTGDGTITVADKNLVTNTANYGKTDATAQSPITDINGDGSVTVADKNIVTNATTYGKSEANYTIQ